MQAFKQRIIKHLINTKALEGFIYLHLLLFKVVKVVSAPVQRYYHHTPQALLMRHHTCGYRKDTIKPYKIPASNLLKSIRYNMDNWRLTCAGYPSV